MRQSIDALIAEAQGRFKEGRPGLARKTCRRILDVDQDNAEALHMLGILDIQRGAMISGVDLIRRAIAAEGDNFIYHNTLAGALSTLGELDEAASHYAMAVEIKPDFAEAWFNFANMERLRGNKEEAAEKFRRAVQASPGFADAYNNLGTQLMQLGRVDEAESILEEVMAMYDPSQPNGVAGSIAGIYAGLGDGDNAVSWISKAFDEGGARRMHLTFPQYDPIRGHPGFDRIIERVGLPALWADPTLGM